jgi:hypothetical protein
MKTNNPNQLSINLNQLFDRLHFVAFTSSVLTKNMENIDKGFQVLDMIIYVLDIEIRMKLVLRDTCLDLYT